MLAIRGNKASTTSPQRCLMRAASRGAGKRGKPDLVVSVCSTWPSNLQLAGQRCFDAKSDLPGRRNMAAAPTESGSAIPNECPDFNSGGPRLLHGVSPVGPWVQAENLKTETGKQKAYKQRPHRPTSNTDP